MNSNQQNERRRPVHALPEVRSLANAECLTGTFQASHDGQLQLEQAEDASYLLTGDDAEPDADVDADADGDEQGDQPADDDGEPETKRKKKKTKGRVKISMEFIEHKSRRYTTFSKRKTGLMKKAYELATLTGAQVMLLVASETGHVYTFATRKLQSMITSESGKALIQTCLNSPDSPSPAAAAQPTSPPTPTPVTASAAVNCPSGVFQPAANHTPTSAYLNLASQAQGRSGNTAAFPFIAKFDESQLQYDSATFQSFANAGDLETGEDSDSQSDPMGASAAGSRNVADSAALRFRKIAPSSSGSASKQAPNRTAAPSGSNRSASALRVVKSSGNSREIASTSSNNISLRTKFVAVPTFHVTDYANSPQVDSDG